MTLTKPSPTVGVLTTSTNSLSRGYLGYLAAMESWRPWVDDFVVVDGGTTDGSYEALAAWIGTQGWRVHSEPASAWGQNDRWHAAQWAINTNVGLAQLNTDWAIVICSDYILDGHTAAHMRQRLADVADYDFVGYRRVKLSSRNEHVTTGLRGVAINLKKIRAAGRTVSYGIARDRDAPSDFPIIPNEETHFIDPATGTTKTVLRGNRVTLGPEMEFTCHVYGHFFFSAEQAETKIAEYNRIYQVRYAGRAPKSRSILAMEYGLRSQNRISPLDIELKRPHPPEIRRVLAEYYRDDMLGHGGGQAQEQPRLTAAYTRAVQAVRSRVLLMRGFPAVRTVQSWSPLDGGGSAAPLDLLALYQDQDRYLPRGVTLDSLS